MGCPAEAHGVAAMGPGDGRETTGWGSSDWRVVILGLLVPRLQHIVSVVGSL